MLADFRSYSHVDVALEAGVSVFVGSNGQGKTNLAEAVDYLSRLSSHRVASDAPLVRLGTERALVRAEVVKHERAAEIEVEIHPGKSNKARINKSTLPRFRDVAGLVRTVVFSPEDITLIKGDPGDRRRFLDDLIQLRRPSMAGVRADYDRVLKQRNNLLKNARQSRRGGRPDEHLASTLEVWNEQLVRFGTQIISSRRAALTDLTPLATEAYRAVAEGSDRAQLDLDYRPHLTGVNEAPDDDAVADLFTAALAEREREELERGISLVGPHRDDLGISLSTSGAHTMPVKGYASHGETWSTALALKLGCFHLLRDEDDSPILILDDVFAELDTSRRDHLARLVVDSEQVIVTAAVADDVPPLLAGRRYHVSSSRVSANDGWAYGVGADD